MSGLVYLFIGLCGAALGVAVYLGLTFSGIEALLLGLVAVLAGVVLLERTLRHRAEARLEKAIDDLARLLSTDAHAGQVLSQRINALTDLDLGARLEVLEADMSVLGTVIRQVAEAVSELESERDGYGDAPAVQAAAAAPASPGAQAAAVIPLAMVEEALSEGRLVHHLQPIVTLPQRKVHGYTLVPRLMLEEGEFAEAGDFLPGRGVAGDRVLRRMDRQGAEQATAIVRRARMMGKPARVFLALSRATLDDSAAVDILTAQLAANRAVTPDISLTLRDADWMGLTATETDRIERLVREGVGLALLATRNLRRDFADIAARGVGYLGIDAARFLADPGAMTDFHSADIADYARRFGIQLLMTDVSSEDQLLSLLDDGIGLAQGPAIALPGPIRTEWRDTEDQLRRAAVH